MNAYTVYATAQESIFTVFWPFSQRSRRIVEDVWTMSEQVVKSKDVRRQIKETPWSRWPFFTRLKGKKKNFNLTIWSKFRAKRWGDMWPTKVGKPSRAKRRCTLHEGMASEEFANFISKVPKDDWPPNSREMNTLEAIWIIIDETRYKNSAWRAKTAITLRLEKCEYRHALGVRSFYTSTPRKCKKT